MSSDDININPNAVKSSGQQLATLASNAKTQANSYFTSQTAAAQGNPGFASGPALVRYADILHSQMNGFIDDLDSNGNKICAAAQSVQTTDADTAEGYSREMSALNGLSQPAIPGP